MMDRDRLRRLLLHEIYWLRFTDQPQPFTADRDFGHNDPPRHPSRITATMTSG
jgi:hypothetical protein